MANRDWHGKVIRRAGRAHLYLKIKVNDSWKVRPTPFVPGEESKAEELLGEVREQLLAAEAAMKGQAGPVTVRAWAKRWLETRRASRRDDESILRNHVLPGPFGDRLLSDVETRHVLEMVEAWQPKDTDGNPAPGAAAYRTVRNWYSTTACMFRDAALRGLIKTTPCIITTPHLPSAEDKDSEWRPTARFAKKELELLISPHAEVEEDSTVTYALLGLADLRHGELAALRWRHLDHEREPLAALLIANSNARRRTKKGKTRLMPIHPVLGAILAEWRLTGWARLIGRPPTDDDLVLPLPLATARAGLPGGAHYRLIQITRTSLQVGEDMRRRTKDFTWKRADRHLEALGLRHRRVHDFRRTFISLATADGADDRILEWGTHGRPGDIMGAYNDSDWTRLCGEVAKLKIARRSEGATVTPLRKAEPADAPRTGSSPAPSRAKADP